MDVRARQAVQRAVTNHLLSCRLGRFGLSGGSENFLDLARVLDKYIGDVVHSISFANVLRGQMHGYIVSALDIFPENVAIADALSSNQLQTVSKKTVEWISKLPRKYHFYFPFPYLANYRRGEIALSDEIAFYEFSPDVEGILYERRHLEGTSFDDPNDLTHKISTTAAYLRIRGTGFFDSFTYSSALAEAISRTKRFLFLVMQTSNAFSDVWPENERVRTGFVAEESIPVERGSAFVVPSTIAACLDRLAFEPWYDNSDGDKLTGAMLAEELRADFSGIIGLESKPELFQSILTACEWAFDSWHESNDSISYIFLSIAFEALLDSRGGAGGLSEMLADSLAHITATSYKEREEVRSKFRKFYQARSKLVHGKKSHLERPERELLEWGRACFVKALQQEISLAKRDL